jgi:hypothetical protein
MCRHGFPILEKSQKNPDQFWDCQGKFPHGFAINEKSREIPD